MKVKVHEWCSKFRNRDSIVSILAFGILPNQCIRTLLPPLLKISKRHPAKLYKHTSHTVVMKREMIVFCTRHWTCLLLLWGLTFWHLWGLGGFWRQTLTGFQVAWTELCLTRCLHMTLIQQLQTWTRQSAGLTLLLNSIYNKLLNFSSDPWQLAKPSCKNQVTVRQLWFDKK